MLLSCDSPYMISLGILVLKAALACTEYQQRQFSITKHGPVRILSEFKHKIIPASRPELLCLKCL